jgi:GMP synthase (glutamine-hydrolysing)
MTRTPRILVIQHNLDDHLNELALPLMQAGIDVVPWDVENQPAPTEPVEAFDGVISLGAIAGVMEESQHAWMPIERRIFERALELEVPLLGICFGSQLLASAAGAEVYKSATPEVGWTRVEMNAAAKSDAVMAALGDSPSVFHFHYDTFDLPIGAELFGVTGDIKQAFKVGPKAWGMQFHIEVGAAAMFSWFATYAREFEKLAGGVDHQKSLTVANWDAYRQRSLAVGNAFAAEVQAFASAR